MELFIYNSALNDEEIAQLSQSSVGPVHQTPMMETAQFAVTTYDEVEILLQCKGIKTNGYPLRKFPITAIVICTQEDHPECHEQADFAALNAIPTFRQEGNPGLITILLNLASK